MFLDNYLSDEDTDSESQFVMQKGVKKENSSDDSFHDDRDSDSDAEKGKKTK